MARTATITITQLANWVGATPRYIQMLTKDGTLERALDDDGKELRGRYPPQAIRAFCDHLRSLNKSDDSGETQRSQLRNQKLAYESELIRIKLQEARGEIHQGAHVEFIWTNIVTHAKTRILAIPSKVARQCVGKNFKQVLELLTTEIHAVLSQLADYSKDLFKEQREQFLEARGVDMDLLDGKNGHSADEATQRN